ncbi:MAG: ATP-sensitive inward rectifier potassium channel 10 [Deltaproteobacteria bacterium]|nr:ATP-sensitive inward rectifier potassium channel 10 [Deltaproteobacteria bacterium]
MPRLADRGVVAIGAPRRPLSDLYHALMTVRWPAMLGLILIWYLLLNLVFALLYVLGGDCIQGAEPGSFPDAFFFSVQTFATIGYGAMAPTTTYAHVLVTSEAFVGMLTAAVATGLIFAKFSKPTARVIFADTAIVAPRNGVPHLMFRLANQRGNQIVEARLQVALARWERTQEGETMRRFHDLELVRQQSLLFVLTWTAMHPIDDRSPLHGATAQSLIEEGAELVVSFVGLDETMNQTVHARWSYRPDEIRWNHRYADIIAVLPDGRRQIDYRVFHNTAPL